jgi:hypothetical protein
MKYQIGGKFQGTWSDNGWSAENIGTHENEFDTREEALEAIALRKLGGEWTDAEYRVVEIQ